MKLLELLKMVIINILRNKFKVLLTSLGIIVGTVTIILVIAIGQGSERQAAAEYSYLSADTIYVNPNYSALGYEIDYSKLEKLTPELIEKVTEESETLSGMYLRVDLYSNVTINRKKTQLSVAGVTLNYEVVSNLYAKYGKNLTEKDMDKYSRNVVIGYKVAEEYFSTADQAIGKYIKIENIQYKVIGVLKQTGDGLQGLDSDNSIIAPYSTLIKDKLISKESIPLAVGKVKKISLVKKSMAEIISTLKYYMNDYQNYTIEDAGSRIDAATKSARNMNMLLISVASIVFVVGGIGIMNVLFVTVKERTKEIGILKALGSKNSDILKQFLIEAASIGIIGGLIGILLSYLSLYYMSSTNLAVYPSVAGKIIAFAFAVGTSTLFGFYPAYKASKLKPIEALNQE